MCTLQIRLKVHIGVKAVYKSIKQVVDLVKGEDNIESESEQFTAEEYESHGIKIFFN